MDDPRDLDEIARRQIEYDYDVEMWDDARRDWDIELFWDEPEDDIEDDEEEDE